MTLQNYQVYYVVGGVETALTNVQHINLTCGVQAQLQQIKASTAEITIRYPSGYASPIAVLVPGTEIVIRNITTTSVYSQNIYRGYISDVSVQYGIPYVGSTGNADFLTIQLEGEYARFGRMQAQNYPMAADTITNQMSAGRTQTGAFMDWFGASTTTAAGTTLTGTWADWLARIAISNNARMRETSAGNRGVYIASPLIEGTGLLNFASVQNCSALNQKQQYDQISFASIADNYYTQINVNPEGFSTQTVTSSTASAPYRTYNVNTLNSSNSQALDYSNYLLGNYSTPKLAIMSISALAEVQYVNRLDNAISFGSTIIPAQLPYYPGTNTTVEFRGTTYDCVIEGVTMSATPESARFTFYLSGADLNAYLLLDNATRGTLNYNKLGY
jgi:hypothetical protein